VEIYQNQKATRNWMAFLNKITGVSVVVGLSNSSFSTLLLQIYSKEKGIIEKIF
jgi:hypothetical protein